MYKREEEQLNDFKKEYDNIVISLDSIDQAIMTGYERAKSDQRYTARKKKYMYSVVAAALLLIGLFSSIRISPAFANYLSEIPGMEKIVSMILDDKGRMAAVDHKYYQELGISDKNGNLIVTIDGTIADEKGIVLFYTLESESKTKEIMIDEVKLKAKDGMVLDEASISYGQPHYSEKGEKSFNGEIEYYFEKPITAKTYVIDLEVRGKEFSIPFTLKEFKEKKEYSVNQTMELEGQKINVEKVTIYPLRVAVHLKVDPANKKKILHLDDMRLVDENNEVWGSITNGVTSSGNKDSDQEIYLQSNYFKEPKELYLVLNSAQAIDKDHAVLMVDTEKMKILKQPQGNMLRNIRKEDQELVFDLYTANGFNFSIFGKISDAQGKEVYPHSASMSSNNESGVNRIGIDFSTFKNLQNPLTIEMDFYPHWIKEHEKIRIK